MGAMSQGGDRSATPWWRAPWRCMSPAPASTVASTGGHGPGRHSVTKRPGVDLERRLAAPCLPLRLIVWCSTASTTDGAIGWRCSRRKA